MSRACSRGLSSLGHLHGFRATLGRVMQKKPETSKMMSNPLIAIIGTTGVGKSDLAVELALHLSSRLQRRADIINADAMQTYRGLDVITNKLSLQEMQGVPHHLMGINKPGKDYRVSDWVKDALEVIRKTHEEGGIPIVVGGTAYWIQYLLLESPLPSLHNMSETAFSSSDKKEIPMSAEISEAVAALPEALHDLWTHLPKSSADISDDDASCMGLYNLLLALDPLMAERWHWKDSRKILRSIWIIKEQGRAASELVATQDEEGTSLPRYPSLVFWLYSRPEDLKPRLDARVDQMLEKGLLKEITAMREIAEKLQAETGVDSRTLATTSIFQAIGYKEFDSYLSNPTPAKEQFDEGVETMKRATWKYARTQILWMKNKMLPAVAAAKAAGGEVDLFVLDATNREEWNGAVRDVAVDLAERFVNQQPLPEPTSLSDVASELLSTQRPADSRLANLLRQKKITCPECTYVCKQPMMYESTEWEAHVRSRVHRRRKEKKEREEDPEWIGNVKRREREAAAAAATVAERVDKEMGDGEEDEMSDPDGAADGMNDPGRGPSAGSSPGRTAL